MISLYTSCHEMCFSFYVHRGLEHSILNYLCLYIYISKEFTPKPQQHIVHKSRVSLERPIPVPEQRDTALLLQWFSFANIQSTYKFSVLHIYSLAVWRYDSLYNQTWISKLTPRQHPLLELWLRSHIFPPLLIITATQKAEKLATDTNTDIIN